MPVEIKELVVRAVVQSSKGQLGEGHGSNTPSAAPRAGLSGEERQALIAASVREVLRILELSKER